MGVGRFVKPNQRISAFEKNDALFGSDLSIRRHVENKRSVVTSEQCVARAVFRQRFRIDRRVASRDHDLHCDSGLRGAQLDQEPSSLKNPYDFQSP